MSIIYPFNTNWNKTIIMKTQTESIYMKIQCTEICAYIWAEQNSDQFITLLCSFDIAEIPWCLEISMCYALMTHTSHSTELVVGQEAFGQCSQTYRLYFWMTLCGARSWTQLSLWVSLPTWDILSFLRYASSPLTSINWNYSMFWSKLCIQAFWWIYRIIKMLRLEKTAKTI